jgi:peroxiredoxin
MLRSTWTIIASSLVVSAAVAGGIAGPAPNFTVESRTGKSISLAEFDGDVVMINFWATWCGPCRQEMPHLDALHERYSDLGFTLLGVNVEKDPSGAEAYLAGTPVSFRILFDPSNEVSKLYEVVAMPTTVLIDRRGNVRFVHHGYKPGYENEYQSQIRALLRER